MAKKADTAETLVVLSCVYSGLEQTYGPGDVLGVAPEEAERLIGQGAATLYVEPEPSADPAE